MKKWIAILMTTAVLDVITTYFCIPLGTIEANPLFRDTTIGEMAVIKVAATVLVIAICLWKRLKVGLILATGINLGVVIGNSMTIWTLRLGG